MLLFPLYFISILNPKFSVSIMILPENTQRFRNFSYDFMMPVEVGLSFRVVNSIIDKGWMGKTDNFDQIICG